MELVGVNAKRQDQKHESKSLPAMLATGTGHQVLDRKVIRARATRKRKTAAEFKGLEPGPREERAAS